MIPEKFNYHRSTSVEDALEQLRMNPGAKLLAGGHSLLAAMKLRLDAPDTLVDIARIDTLNYIREDSGDVCIGAATTHAAIAASDLISRSAPILGMAAAAIGDMQVRNMGTIGGSIAHADPAADYPGALLAADARIVVRYSRGERTLDANGFFRGLFDTALEAGDLITEVRIPVSSGGAAYEKFAQPASRFAIVGCAAIVRKKNGVCEHAAVAFNGVGFSAFRDDAVEAAIRGKQMDEANIAAAAQLAVGSRDVMEDHFASGDYRRHLARVYAARALKAAAERAA